MMRFLLLSLAALAFWPSGATALGAGASVTSEQQQSSSLRAKRPFLVDWKLRFANAHGQEAALAATVSQEINTPGSPLQKLLTGSVAKLAGGALPPAQLPPPSPPPLIPTGNTGPFKPAQTSMAVATHALAVAKENEARMRTFSDKLFRASEAHADGLTYSDKTMGGAATEAPPSFAKMVDDSLKTTPPPTLPPE